MLAPKPLIQGPSKRTELYTEKKLRNFSCVVQTSYKFEIKGHGDHLEIQSCKCDQSNRPFE